MALLVDTCHGVDRHTHGRTYLPLVILHLVKVTTLKECSGVSFIWWLQAFNLHRRGGEGGEEGGEGGREGEGKGGNPNGSPYKLSVCVRRHGVVSVMT